MRALARSLCGICVLCPFCFVLIYKHPFSCRELDKLPGMEGTALMDYLKELTGVDKQPWLFLKGKAARHWLMLVCLGPRRSAEGWVFVTLQVSAWGRTWISRSSNALAS